MTWLRTWRLARLTVLSLLLRSSLVSAQSASTTSAASSAANSSTASYTSNSPITHTINVAQGGFTFVPDVTLAEVGDYVQYNFYPTNHSVVRAEYLYPCIPYEDTGVDKIGFFSGFKPVDTIISNPPTFTVRVNDSNPIFYYCSAPGSCINYGMVGVINPSANESLAVQRQVAENSSFMLQPGEAWPSESTPDPFSSSASSTPTSTSSSTHSSTSSAATTATTTTVADASTSHSSSLTSGAIAGIAIGAAAVALLAAALFYLCGRQSRRSAHQPVPQHPYDPHMSYMNSNPSASKHATMMSGHESGAFNSSPYSSPALPGYVPSHDPAMSPPMRPYYAPSDALSPAGDADNTRTPSPGQMMRGVGVPPYTSMAQSQQNTDVHILNSSGPVHEMDAPTQEQGGFMNLIRKASTRKSGGVERYG